MAKHVLNVLDAVVKFADTEVGLDTGTEFSCQVISAALTTSPVTVTVAATFCESETEVVGKTRYSLELSFLQDWDVPGGGLSNYLYENDALERWFSISLTEDTTAPVATGRVRIVAGQYGGDAGAPLQGDSTMPCQERPVIVVPAAVP